MTDTSCPTTEVTTPCGTKLRIRTVRTGEYFGRKLEFENFGPAMFVEFYDPTGDESVFGRILSRYTAERLVSEPPKPPINLVVRSDAPPVTLSPEVVEQVKALVMARQPAPEEILNATPVE